MCICLHYQKESYLFTASLIRPRPQRPWYWQRLTMLRLTRQYENSPPKVTECSYISCLPHKTTGQCVINNHAATLGNRTEKIWFEVLWKANCTANHHPISGLVAQWANTSTPVACVWTHGHGFKSQKVHLVFHHFLVNKINTIGLGNNKHLLCSNKKARGWMCTLLIHMLCCYVMLLHKKLVCNHLSRQLVENIRNS